MQQAHAMLCSKTVAVTGTELRMSPPNGGSVRRPVPKFRPSAQGWKRFEDLSPRRQRHYRAVSDGYGFTYVPFHQRRSLSRRISAKWRWGVFLGALPVVPT
jgi:hypothetical protein